jgi:membrane carboxypeptidase/penicillin-binding protein
MTRVTRVDRLASHQQREKQERNGMRILRMRLLYKISLSMAALVLMPIAAVCGWLFVYTGDLPDTDHLSQFAPRSPSPVLDSCLASPSMAIPFDRIGKTLRDALAAAEPAGSLSDQIARTLMCNRRERSGRYQLNAFRLGWHIRRRFSEQQVFTIYANRAYFGSGATGVESASKLFFNKDAGSSAHQITSRHTNTLRKHCNGAIESWKLWRLKGTSAQAMQRERKRLQSFRNR